MNKTLVSACIITYNHGDFIKECLEGIINQIVNFDYEIIIGEDFSSDNTLQICKEYAELHPNLITLLSGKNNLGTLGNWINTIQSCKGQYIALCEGDDYWVDPYKLQKQVDYISKNDDCNLVFTDVKVFNQSHNEFYANWANIQKEKYKFKDLIAGNLITTCTVLFRNPNNKIILQNWLKDLRIVDFPLYLLLLRSGYAYFINDVTAVYRQHSNGIFSLKGSAHMIDTYIQVLQTINKLSLTKKELFGVRKSLVKWYYARIMKMSNDLEFKAIRPFIKEALKFSDAYYNHSYFFRILILFFFPKIASVKFQKRVPLK